MNHSLKVLKCFFFVGFSSMLLASCGSNNSRLSSEDKINVKRQVIIMMTNMQHDITKKGPLAWLDYFEDSADFFMVSDGALVFQNYKGVKEFVLNKLAKNTVRINLQLNQLRVDPLTVNLAAVVTGFHEDLTNTSGKTSSIDGYLTGTAHLNGGTWKLRNANWSIKPVATAH